MKKLFIALIACFTTFCAHAEDVLQVVPFTTTAGIVADDGEMFEIRLSSTNEYKAVQFDLYLPNGIFIDMDYPYDLGERCPVVGKGNKAKEQHNASVTKKDDIEGHYLVMLYPKDDATVEVFTDAQDDPLLYLYYATSEDIKPGVYPIRIEGTVLGIDGSTGVYPDNSVSFVTVEVEGAEVPNSILDLADNLVPSFVEEELPSQNVIIGDVCSNLVLTDGNSFSTPRQFTATNATYERSMANTWGTIILPYDVQSNDDVEYYIPTAVVNDMLVLEKQTTLPANTPALVAKINGEKIQANAQNVTINASAGTTANGTVTMYGTYENNTKIDNPDAYYIKNNQFLRCNGYFFIDAFRAYFTVSGANAKVLGIPGIGETTAIEALLKEDNAKGVSYYDESGKQMKSMKSGVNIIRLSNGQVIKVKR